MLPLLLRPALGFRVCLLIAPRVYRYGNSFKIPNTKIPNDLVAPYWTDLNPEHGGQIYTSNGTYDQACPVGLSHGRSCCAAICGTCGGTGCSARMGGASACCEGNILKANKKCSTTQTAPCVMDERHFAIQWDAVPMFKSTAKSTFQALLFESGKIKFQYLDVSAPTDTHVSVGIENGAGTEGLQVAYDDPSFYSRKNFSCVSPPRLDLYCMECAAASCDGSCGIGSLLLRLISLEGEITLSFLWRFRVFAADTSSPTRAAR